MALCFIQQSGSRYSFQNSSRFPDEQTQFQPLQSPVDFPWAWHLRRQAVSVEHRANWLALKVSSLQSHPEEEHVPSLRPMALHVPLQKLAPRSHLLGRSSFKSSKVNGSAEHSHSPSLVQIPVFFSWTLQLAMQDHSPMEHRNPASTKLIDADPKKKKVINVRRFIVQCS